VLAVAALAAGAAACAGLRRGPEFAAARDDAGADARAGIAAAGIIETICGGDSSGRGDDGAIALDMRLSYPVAVEYDREGRLLIADSGNHRVLRVETDGGAHDLLGGVGEGEHAGHGHAGHEHHHAPAAGDAASAPRPHHPYGLAVAADGAVLVAGNLDPKIYRIAPDGSAPITILAGADTAGFGGDGGPAAEATLDAPLGVAVDPRDGSFLIADSGNHRVRRVRADGVIETIAGTGEPGGSGDGGPALAARLSAPFRAAVDPRDGSILVADTGNHRVRRLLADGTIVALAGTGERGFSGDGGPALAARLDGPEDARVGPDGAIYIADSGNHRVRRVLADGTIETVAGDGVSATRGDGGDARAASLRHPSGLAFDPQGRLVIAEAFGHRVRRVSLPRKAPAGPPKTNR
jgi:DNA-binding beta-propeller fold protein YncE